MPTEFWIKEWPTEGGICREVVDEGPPENYRPDGDDPHYYKVVSMPSSSVKEKIREWLAFLTALLFAFFLGIIYGHHLTQKEYHCLFQAWTDPDPICLEHKDK